MFLVLTKEGVGDTPDSYAYDGNRVRKWNVTTTNYGKVSVPNYFTWKVAVESEYVAVFISYCRTEGYSLLYFLDWRGKKIGLWNGI